MMLYDTAEQAVAEFAPSSVSGIDVLNSADL
jgi:hypothetical protein